RSPTPPALPPISGRPLLCPLAAPPNPSSPSRHRAAPSPHRMPTTRAAWPEE
ncbi:hypothetical protein SRHO_G00129340, partial [Serrasalmus rhombeus]